MEPSSPANRLPEGVSEADLYEGPKVLTLPSGKAAFVAQAQQAPATPLGPLDLVQPIPPTPTPIAQPLTRRSEAEAVVPTLPDQSAYVSVIGLALDVLATKVHALVALVAAVSIWGVVVYNPDPYRIMAAGAFSVLVFLPMMVIYWRAGMKGETDA